MCLLLSGADFAIAARTLPAPRFGFRYRLCAKMRVANEVGLCSGIDAARIEASLRSSGRSLKNDCAAKECLDLEEASEANAPDAAVAMFHEATVPQETERVLDAATTTEDLEVSPRDVGDVEVALPQKSTILAIAGGPVGETDADAASAMAPASPENSVLLNTVLSPDGRLDVPAAQPTPLDEDQRETLDDSNEDFVASSSTVAVDSSTTGKSPSTMTSTIVPVQDSKDLDETVKLAEDPSVQSKLSTLLDGDLEEPTRFEDGMEPFEAPLEEPSSAEPSVPSAVEPDTEPVEEPESAPALQERVVQRTPVDKLGRNGLKPKPPSPSGIVVISDGNHVPMIPRDPPKPAGAIVEAFPR